jgi:16S rRNA (guanine527-N7)-methyltransferase
MEIILKYFPELTSGQQEKFRELERLYRDWNEKINLISRKDIDHLYEKHILHSLSIAKIIRFKSMTSILDVGTGGGFPGIPLAIFFPEVKFHLIDSIGKKIKVVQEVSEKLSLKNVKAEQIRAEDVEDQYDFVVSRAVTRLKPFYCWVRDKFLKGGFNSLDNGILYLKGGELDEELKELGKKAKVFELSDFFEEEFFETKKVVYLPVR